MITLVTGIPGSGKSYYAVNMIANLKDKDKVLHNVDGLKVGTVLDTFCAENNCSPISLFTNEYHKNNDRFRGWLFVVDECQTLFPKNLRNEDVLRFFQLHRHYGIDIVLLSQDYKLICPAISLLSEYQFRAVSDTANPLPGTFMYRKMVGYEQIGRKFLRKKKKVFELYKTADFDQKKVRKKARPMLVIFIICSILAVYGITKILGYKNRRKNIKSSPDKQTTFQQKKSALQSRLDKYQTSGNQPYSAEQPYPESYLQELNNLTLCHLDTIQDSRGTFFLFMETLWPIKDFPYKIIKTRLGYSALIPLDLFQYIKSQKILLAELTPDNPDNQITDTVEDFSQPRSFKKPDNF